MFTQINVPPVQSAVPLVGDTEKPPCVLELAIVVPTYNEAGNVGPLIAQLEQTLGAVRWELIFVDDDSPDATAALVRELALLHPQVRCLRRVGRRGLAGACVEGMLATHAQFIAVMDADLQHDETLLPKMLQALRDEPLDLVVGSRYLSGGGLGEWSQRRKGLSSIATRLGQQVLGVDLSDPMSGFFMIRRLAFESCVHGLSSLGFKLLLDLVASAPKPLRVRELPFQFRLRQRGASKLDRRVMWDFLMLLIDKQVGRWVPTQLVSFGLIGAMGMMIHMALLKSVLQLLSWPFVWAQSAATLLAMGFNFFLNNALTYQDQRLSGWAMWGGLLRFMLACGLGAIANVGVANYVFKDQAGWMLSGLAGVLVGLGWNYGASSLFVWRRPRGG
jgi:dolichol-phosphate mannosyltransferase